MGLEWHNRKRSTNGRFAKEKKVDFYTGEGTQQFHIRVPKLLADRVRLEARTRKMEISEYCCMVLEKHTP